MDADDVVIVPYRDGPYLVRGPVTLRDQEGREIDTRRSTIALCRCGKSRLRPFCDGSHHLVRFRAPSAPETRGGDRPARPAPPAGTAPPAATGPHLAGLDADLLALRRRLLAISDASSGPGAAAAAAEAGRLLAAASALLQAGSTREPRPGP